MCASMQCVDLSAECLIANPPVDTGNWYAVLTRARHEKIIAHRLQQQAISTFLPLVTEVHRWSDRKKKVELPLFSCYLFTRLAPTNEARLRVLRVDGVFRLVGVRGKELPFPMNRLRLFEPWSKGGCRCALIPSCGLGSACASAVELWTAWRGF